MISKILDHAFRRYGSAKSAGPWSVFIDGQFSHNGTVLVNFHVRPFLAGLNRHAHRRNRRSIDPSVHPRKTKLQFLSIHSTEVVGSQHVNWDQVIDQLERMSAEFCPRKEANVLINGGNCDIGTDDGKVKGKANFSSINGIWLDIDDGELTPHELANVILPQFKLVIFNSFNNGVDGELD
jgi:hypothetical protein